MMGTTHGYELPRCQRHPHVHGEGEEFPDSADKICIPNEGLRPSWRVNRCRLRHAGPYR